KHALVETFKRRSPLGLVGESINVETGAWTDTDSHIGGGIDSYYEYLWKCWLLFGDKDCLEMWRTSVPAVNTYLEMIFKVNCGTGMQICKRANEPKQLMARLTHFCPPCLRYLAILVEH